MHSSEGGKKHNLDKVVIGSQDSKKTYVFDKEKGSLPILELIWGNYPPIKGKSVIICKKFDQQRVEIKISRVRGGVVQNFPGKVSGVCMMARWQSVVYVLAMHASYAMVSRDVREA